MNNHRYLIEVDSWPKEQSTSIRYLCEKPNAANKISNIAFCGFAPC